MSSALTITLHPASPRTTLPIEVVIGGDEAARARVVVSSSGRDLFPVEIREGPHGRAGTFWVRQPGDYRVRAQVPAAGGEIASVAFHVAEQRYLSFPVEFGVFGLALILAGGGLILWYRNRKKRGSS